MIQLSTKNCHKFGHSEFTINFDPATALECDAQWLISTLEEEVSSGTKYFPEETFQVGWMVTSIKQLPNGNLALFEPNMKDLPIRWVNSVTQSLMDLRVQKSVAESVGLVDLISFPSIRHSAVKCKDIDSTDGFALSRLQPNGPDSGWFFGCSDPGHDHNDPKELVLTSLYEVACCSYPSLRQFVALPAETTILFKGNDLSIAFQNKELTFRQGSYLQKIFSPKGFPGR